MTTKQKKGRKGLGKGIPKLRTVLGRRRFTQAGETFIIELHNNGIHTRKLFSKEVRPILRFDEIVALSDVQLELISVCGKGLPEGEQVENNKQKEIYGSKKEQVHQDPKTEQAA